MNKKNYAIDFFRCFFTLIVVIHHLKVPWINHGYLAVEFFFILSGYLLIQTYDKNGESVSAWDYTMGRLKKLYPHYLLSFIVLFIFYYTIGEYPGIEALFKAIPEILLVQNIGIFKGNINYPLWYLSVLIVGGYFLYYSISKRKDDFIKFFAPMIILFTYTLLIDDGNGIENWTIKSFIYMPLLRGLADMSIGMIIYEICKGKNITSKKINKYIIYLMEMISVVSIIYILMSKNNYDIYGILFIVFLIYSCFNKVGIIYKVLNLKFFGDMSKYTYPIYLNHSLFTYAYPKIKGILNDNVSLMLILIGLIIYSIITYEIVNKISEKFLKSRNAILNIN